METQVKEQEHINDSEAVQKVQNSAPVVQAEQTASEMNNQMQRISKQASDFFAELPNKASRFYQEYKFPVLSFALLVVTIISLRIGLAVLGAVNSIPFVRPFFELIGMGYTIWFVFRYLLKGSTRQELVTQFRSAKKQIMGNSAS